MPSIVPQSRRAPRSRGRCRRIATRLAGRFFNNRDEGVAPLLRHPAGAITLSDAGAHLTYLCDAGFGLHLLGHWVRETGTFTLAEAVRRLTSHPAQAFRIPGRGRIEPGAHADLLLFDPATVGISRLRGVADLPGGGRRLVRDPVGVHGVWVNGVRTFDGRTIVSPGERGGPGAVLDRFDAWRGPGISRQRCATRGTMRVVRGHRMESSRQRGDETVTTNNRRRTVIRGALGAAVLADQGKLDYASSGTGTITHLATAALASQLGLEMTHVPYKGSALLTV